MTHAAPRTVPSPSPARGATLAAVLSLCSLCSILGALGCGGSGDKRAAEPVAEPAEPGPAHDDGTSVISNDAMDEIRHALDRKRHSVARCLTPAVEAGELPKNARGRITLGFVISASGHARDIKVIKASLKSEMVSTCVIERVGEIEFPTLPNDLPWSYTYGFEAM
ncbi:MAG: AgmX/PglI C-terminal domain-containing protein [Kofleriaceae bacterium]